MTHPNFELQSGASGEHVKRLHSNLRLLGSDVASEEIQRGMFGESTTAAVQVFQERHDLNATGVLDAVTGALLDATARFNSEGNTAEMRQELRTALQAHPDQPALGEWLARYEILAHDYTAARGTLDRVAEIPGAGSRAAPLRDIVADPGQNRPNPEVPYPGNFYTYRYSFFDITTINTLLHALAQLVPDSAANLAVMSNIATILPRRQPDGERLPPIDPSDPSPTPPEPPQEPPEQDDPQVARAGYHAISALWHWYLGNQDLSRGLFSRAVDHYTDCQFAVIDYFRFLNPAFKLSTEHTLHNLLIYLMTDIYLDRDNRPYFFQVFSSRSSSVSLNELFRIDWEGPRELLASYLKAEDFLVLLRGTDRKNRMYRQGGLEAPLVTLAYIMAPLARAEANRQRRQFRSAMGDVNQVVFPLLILDPSRIPDPLPTDPGRRLIDVPTGAARSIIDIPITIEAPFKLIAEFIELPFARQLKARILLDQADAEYKARTPADLERFPEAGQFQGLQAAKTYMQALELFTAEGDYREKVDMAANRLRNSLNRLLAKRFHPLAPSTTGEGPLNETDRREFQMLGKQVTIPTIESETKTLPGLDRRSGMHEPLLRFQFPEAGATTNPAVFALVAEAQARLLQISAGFNYLGYKDDYIPPWRFQFLLERSRYFTEHAKNAQRDYLNFLSNAEQQEFQELSAAQAVEMEKSNIRIEAARVDQARLETEAAKQGAELAHLQADNAQARLEAFRKFDDYADSLTGFGIGGDIIDAGVGFLNDVRDATSGLSDIFIPAPGFGAMGLDAIDIPGFGGSGTKFQQSQIESARREYEKFNLQLAVAEAKKSEQIANTQLEAARAGLVVAGLQRAAALLRHEFALQNLNFLRNRSLNAEMWYRLAAMIREISNTYMRYAMEMAFLAEQAYEFEADKRINVIRFDYDVSEVGSLLAADFLLRDLDTLEKDLIINQRQRQQQVRYVLSLVNEFPEAIQELRDTGSTVFNLRLEQLERRFPGLYNIRIGSVDVTPIALMNPTRFSLEMTYLGASQIRLKAQPDTPPGIPSPSPLNENDLERFLFVSPARVLAPELDQEVFSSRMRGEFIRNDIPVPPTMKVKKMKPGLEWQIFHEQRDDVYLVRQKDEQIFVYQIGVYDDWLTEIRDEWPVKFRTSGPETNVFSGLTSQDRTAAFGFISSNQRGAFEGLGGAASWRIDMSMKENQVVPGTLVDLMLTFTVSGYYDVDLRTAIDRARRKATVLTRWLSARQRFADALYEFKHSGKMVWDVTSPMLSIDNSERNLRNVGIFFLSSPRQVQFNRLMSNYEVEIEVDERGQFRLLTPIPEVSFSLNQLRLTASVAGVSNAKISWDFGDGEGFQTESQHLYKRPGKYHVGLRLIVGSHLHQYLADIAVSRTQALSVPLTASPVFAPSPGTAGEILARAKVPANESVTIVWRVDQRPFESTPEQRFKLSVGVHTIRFAAVRKLKAQIYNQQRYVPDKVLDFDGLRIRTNRVFDLDGGETTGSGNNPPANALTEHLFPRDPSSDQRMVLSPTDRWTLELPINENPFLHSVTSSDNLQIDLNEVEDAILIIEYEAS